ncbi:MULTISPECIES: glycosyltransferase family 4 protein [Pseudoalteromonas]|uniref:Glycosyltransferase subfamily 4-like N-terminal domain-containing protein n=1 Tax=Pseudoalteromonas amylolytica TaxID=1859457 RepID=A0A1S1MY89_9GAMM|nr:MULTISPECIES: glycosyltransferase [Pseudoalteromonas]OHU90677.1 hypothetical protein BFC16_03485 [Pseudoalteromonas sp. JW3]OHU92702.1 hypothetical protein BET10_04405 [Pseudoalteromonas amylolytica]
MKVVHVIIGLNLGGAETALFRLITSQHNEDIEHVVISLTDLGYYGQKFAQNGIKVYSLGKKGKLNVILISIKLFKLLRRLEVDVVQTWMYHSDLLGGLVARLARVKKVFWGVRCTYVPQGSKGTYLLMKSCALLSGFIPNKVICVAKAAQRSHVKYGYNKKNMIVIPNGFNVEYDNVSQITYPPQTNNAYRKLWADKVTIGCVGRFHPDKGIDVLVQAAKQLTDRADNVHFVLAGLGCDKANEELRTLLEKLQLQEHFTLLGQINDVPELLSAIDIYCMPSRTEGFPNGLGEGMAMGLPCVATDAGDAQYLAGDAFKVVKTNSADELANALLKLLKMTPKERDKIGALCFERVSKHFSQRVVVEQYSKIYK